MADCPKIFLPFIYSNTGTGWGLGNSISIYWAILDIVFKKIILLLGLLRLKPGISLSQFIGTSRSFAPLFRGEIASKIFNAFPPIFRAVKTH